MALSRDALSYVASQKRCSRDECIPDPDRDRRVLRYLWNAVAAGAAASLADVEAACHNA